MLFNGWSIVFTRLSMGSVTFEYVRSPFFNCSEKKGKLTILWSILSIVLLLCRNRRPIKGLVCFVLTMNFSLMVMSPTSNWKSTIAIGTSVCPLATIIWNAGGGLHLVLWVEPASEFHAILLPKWYLKKHLCLWVTLRLTTWNQLETMAFCVFFQWWVC